MMTTQHTQRLEAGIFASMMCTPKCLLRCRMIAALCLSAGGERLTTSIGETESSSEDAGKRANLLRVSQRDAGVLQCALGARHLLLLVRHELALGRQEGCDLREVGGTRAISK